MTSAQTYFTNFTCAVFYITLYKNEFPFFENYKAFDEPWPWNADKKKWQELLKETFWLLLFNFGVVSPFLCFLHAIFGIPLDFDTRIEGVPTAVKFVAQLIFCAICEDFFFHLSHRMLHTPWFY